MAEHVCSFVGVAAAVAALVSLIMHCEHHQAIITLKRHVKYLKFQLLQALSSKVQLLHCTMTLPSLLAFLACHSKASYHLVHSKTMCTLNSFACRDYADIPMRSLRCLLLAELKLPALPTARV